MCASSGRRSCGCRAPVEWSSIRRAGTQDATCNRLARCKLDARQHEHATCVKYATRNIQLAADNVQLATYYVQRAASRTCFRCLARVEYSSLSGPTNRTSPTCPGMRRRRCSPHCIRHLRPRHSQPTKRQYLVTGSAQSSGPLDNRGTHSNLSWNLPVSAPFDRSASEHHAKRPARPQGQRTSGLGGG